MTLIGERRPQSNLPSFMASLLCLCPIGFFPYKQVHLFGLSPAFFLTAQLENLVAHPVGSEPGNDYGHRAKGRTTGAKLVGAAGTAGRGQTCFPLVGVSEKFRFYVIFNSKVFSYISLVRLVV